jgi:hypothetical protein
VRGGGGGAKYVCITKYGCIYVICCQHYCNPLSG